jgi:hypothetical protein
LPDDTEVEAIWLGPGINLIEIKTGILEDTPPSSDSV